MISYFSAANSEIRLAAFSIIIGSRAERRANAAASILKSGEVGRQANKSTYPAKGIDLTRSGFISATD